MNKQSTSILASFVTLKSLTETKTYQSSYQLLSEFIEYIIIEDSVYNFSAIEMKNKLKEFFGFDIPEAVIKTATKSLSYVTKVKTAFQVNHSHIDEMRNKIKILNEAKLSAERNSSNILSMLQRYIEEQSPGEIIDQNALEHDFISFLVADQQSYNGKYTRLIGAFIISHENDIKLQECLNDIREGSILYIGINYNINETGSIIKPLTLFLDTEVLFSLMGYNGTIYEQLAKDFYEQVKNANSKERKIHLRYFSDVKKEIDDFFSAATMIVEGKKMPSEKAAMKFITNGCKTAADVKIKQADFYHKLQLAYNIIEDQKTDYYAETNNLNNLESLENNEQELDAWKFISHINKLRKGKVFNTNLDSEYLFVTNTNDVLRVSREQVECLKRTAARSSVNDYAVSVDWATNILWFKLGNGFGRKEYPANINTVLKAKVVLASNIAHDISKVYNETKKQYEQGKITVEQVAARITALRKQTVLPEELSNENIDEKMEVSSDYVARFEEEVRLNREKLEQKDEELLQKDKIIEEQSVQNREMKEKISFFETKEKELREKKERRRKVKKFAFTVMLRVAVFILITVLVVLAVKYINQTFLNVALITVDVVAAIVSLRKILKSDIEKYLSRKDKK